MKRSISEAFLYSKFDNWSEDFSSMESKNAFEKTGLAFNSERLKNDDTNSINQSGSETTDSLSSFSTDATSFPMTSLHGSKSVDCISHQLEKADVTTEKAIVNKSHKDDVHGPYHIQHRVLMIAGYWMKTIPIAPDQYLTNLLKCRGYDAGITPSISSSFRKNPTTKQIYDFDNELVWAVRNSDLSALHKMNVEGKSMSACNRFSESIVHMACRRSEFFIVEYLLENGGSHNIVDDYGRTPLHDACWRPQPRFDIVTILLERDLSILRLADVRGSLPLHYVRKEHWLEWCAYFYHQKEKYWAIGDEETRKTREIDLVTDRSLTIQESFQSPNAEGPLYWESSDETVDKIKALMI